MKITQTPDTSKTVPFHWGLGAFIRSWRGLWLSRSSATHCDLVVTKTYILPLDHREFLPQEHIHRGKRMSAKNANRLSARSIIWQQWNIITEAIAGRSTPSQIHTSTRQTDQSFPSLQKASALTIQTLKFYCCFVN